MRFTPGHALLIGVDRYHHVPQLDVPVAGRDARALATLLQDPQFCGYPTEQVTVLDNQHATREGILGSFDTLASRTTPEDTVVVFYCGHGDFGDDGHYYLTTHDTRVANQRVASGTGISHQELLVKLKALPALRALLVFNACHSGAISPTLGAPSVLGGTTLPAETAEALLATGEGRIVITACREGQVSYIGAGATVGSEALTIFTEALVDSLRGKGVPNRNGYVSAFDLYTAVFDTVTEVVQERYGQAQEPELTVQKGVGPMAVALYRGATALGIFEAPAELEPHTSAREVSPKRSERRYQQIMVGYQQIGDRTEIHTGGGAHVGGNVHVGGGGFVGRDQNIYGDQVRGSKIGGDQITIGNMTGNTGVAIGRGAQARVTSGITSDQLTKLFSTV